MKTVHVQSLLDLGLKPSELAVYLVMASETNGDSLFCSPVSSLSTSANLAKSQIPSKVARLVESGLLEVVEQPSNKPATYRVFAPVDMIQDVPADREPSRKRARSQPSATRGIEVHAVGEVGEEGVVGGGEEGGKQATPPVTGIWIPVIAAPKEPSSDRPVREGGDGPECLVPESWVREWEAAYPAVDVERQVIRAAQWVRNNPDRRKTYSHLKRYFGKWLSREDDKLDRARRTGPLSPMELEELEEEQHEAMRLEQGFEQYAVPVAFYRRFPFMDRRQWRDDDPRFLLRHDWSKAVDADGGDSDQGKFSSWVMLNSPRRNPREIQPWVSESEWGGLGDELKKHGWPEHLGDPIFDDLKREITEALSGERAT